MGIDVAGLLKTVAPTLVSMLGGPVAGLAYELLGKAMGTTAEEAQKVVASGQLTGDQVAAIKVAEAEAKAKETEFGFKFAELDIRDRESARSMQSATPSMTPTVLTYLVTGGFFGTLAWMLADPTVVNSPPILIMLGQLSAGWAAAIAFWLGTTSSSKMKDATIQAQASGRRQAVP